MIIAAPTNQNIESIEETIRDFKCRVDAVNKYISGSQYESIWLEAKPKLQKVIEDLEECADEDEDDHSL